MTAFADTVEARRLASEREWFGYLTVENLDAVAARLRRLIGNREPFTWVACNEGLWNYAPEVRTSQVAEKIDVHRHDGWSGINVVDSYGVWGLSTRVPDSRAPDLEPGFWSPYLHFKRGQLHIEHRVLAGHRVLWVIAVEDHQDAEHVPLLRVPMREDHARDGS
jgi:hypothetical protein